MNTAQLAWRRALRSSFELHLLQPQSFFAYLNDQGRPGRQSLDSTDAVVPKRGRRRSRRVQPENGKPFSYFGAPPMHNRMDTMSTATAASSPSVSNALAINEIRQSTPVVHLAASIPSEEVKLPSPYPCMRRRVTLTVVGIVQLAFACLIVAAGGYRLYDLYHNSKPSTTNAWNANLTTTVDSATGACILGLSIALASLLAVLGAIITSTALILSHCLIVTLSALQFTIARCEVLVDRRDNISSDVYWSELGNHESFDAKDLYKGTTAGALIVVTALGIISASLGLSIVLCRTLGRVHMSCRGCTLFSTLLSTLISLALLTVSALSLVYVTSKGYENNDRYTYELPTDWRAASVRTLVAACALVVSFVALMVAVVSKSRGTIAALWGVLTLPVLYTLFYGNGTLITLMYRAANSKNINHEWTIYTLVIISVCTQALLLLHTPLTVLNIL